MESYLKEQNQNDLELKETPVYEVGDDGNVCVHNHKLHFEKDGIQLSRDYWNII